jgi:hypothetical protein
MCEFIAVRLPIVTTAFGARGFRIEDGRTGFLFDRPTLHETLIRLARLFDEAPGHLREIAERAFCENQHGIDMDSCVEPLMVAMDAAGR